ncbi:MAG: biopolymer transporter ExbD [Pseudomonadota bacterium]
MKELLAGSRRRTVELDVSLAIVNIVLLLIFFFLATGRLLNPVDARIDLADTSDLPLDQLPSPILVVSADGSWALDGKELAVENLQLGLNGLPLPEDPKAERLIHLLIDKAAPASVLLAIVNRPEFDPFEVRLVTLHRRGGRL